MYWLQRLLALVALVGCSQQQLTTPDPCDPATYAILDEPYRSAGFKTEAPETPLCDMLLAEGWYRFNSTAGGVMPMKCQQNLQCGTIVPIWMNGNLPSDADGIVERQACANFNSDQDHCCERSRDIKVRKCSGFYVYYLYPTPSCPVSYCAGEDAPCPVGQWSETLFPPCIDAFPKMKFHPKLWGPNYDNTSFDFHCEVNFTDKHPKQRFEVSWLFGGQEDPTVAVEILSDPFRVSTLDGSKLKGHLNENIECQVRSYYDGNVAHKSEYLRSNAYYAALEVNPPRLEFSETDTEKSVYLTSTVPIICDYKNAECCLYFPLDLNASDNVVIATNCTPKLCAEDWDYDNNSATIEINVAAKEIIAQGNEETQLLLSFEKTSPAGGQYLDIFKNVKPNDVQIARKKTGTFTCSATGDPHFTSFDGMKSNLYLRGDFTAVRVPKRNFEVQIRTWACNPAASVPVTCICGVTVREGDDLVRIDQCDQTFGGSTTSPKITTPKPLQEGTVLQRSADGKQIGVYLRSGAQIRFETSPNSIGIFINLPSTDKGSASGICGTNDGDENNEFTYPDGRVGSDCKDCSTSSAFSCCTPYDFMKAWRVNDTTSRPSLFMTIPDPLNEKTDTRYCSCQQKDIVCDIREKAPMATTTCPNQCGWVEAEVVTPNAKRGLIYEDADEPDVANDFLRREETSDVHTDYNKSWPTNEADGITEAQARDMCTTAILKSRLSSRVDESTKIFKETVGLCMEDILFSESTAFLKDATTAFTASSQVSLAKDPANYVTDDATGKPVMKPEFVQDVCDVSCEEHGQCGEKGGGCVCNEGWEGYSCHIEKGKGPVLDKIRSGPLCDIGERPCQKIYTDVFNINLSDKLMCRVQPVDEDGNNIGPAVDTEASSLTAYRISCALPETSVSHKRYNISASNDGALFGNQLPLLVFNSLCMNCDETACTAKASACHIDSKCYRDGHINEDDSTKMCDISKATDVWSDVPTTTTTTTTTTTIPTSTTTVPTTTTTLPSTSTMTTTTTAPTTTAADDSSPCLKNGLLDGLNPDPSDCHKFIVCAFGSVNTVKCQAGLWFDIDTKSCQPPHVANCPAMGKP